MANLLVKGSAFPGSPSHGDPFFRDDLGMWCSYDTDAGGWVSPEYMASLEQFTLSATAGSPRIFINTTYAPFITRIALRSTVVTTNDGSNYWTMDCRSFSVDGTATSIYSVNTSSDAADTATNHSTATPDDTTPAEYGGFFVYATKTSSPGAITTTASVFYKLIIT